MNSGNIFERLHRPGYFVIGDDLVDSPYSIATTGPAYRRGYTCQQQQNFSHCLDTIGDIIAEAHEKRFIYAYWPLFDSMAHRYGVGSDMTLHHYRALESQFGDWLKKIQGSDTLFLITADHGFIDSVPENTIYLHDHPLLQRCLSLPLCGEPRVAYCYVRADSADDFTGYVQRHLSEHFDWYASNELIGTNWFGIGEPDARLAERVGDYILVARGNSVIVDRLANEKPWSLIGVHGGTSEDEMYVPLIMLRC